MGAVVSTLPSFDPVREAGARTDSASSASSPHSVAARSSMGDVSLPATKAH